MPLKDYTYGRKSGNLPVEDIFLKAIGGLPSKPSTTSPVQAPILPDRGQPIPEPPTMTLDPYAGRQINTSLQQGRPSAVPQLIEVPFVPSAESLRPLNLAEGASPDKGRGFLGNVLHGLSSGLSTFGQALVSPGGRQATAQLAGVIGRGNPLAEGLSGFAQQMAKNDQYARIKEFTLKGLPVGPTETAGLAPEEVEQVRQQALSEQQAKLDRQQKKLREESLMLTEAQKRAQSVAETGLAAAQTGKILAEPTAAEKQKMELEQRAISAGVQTFPVGVDQEKSFVYDPAVPGGIRYLGTGTKTKSADSGAGIAQERLDFDQYKQALAEVAKDPEITKIGKLVETPGGGADIVLNFPERDRPILRRKILEVLTQRTARGLIKNPAYLQAAKEDIPYEFEGATFTGQKNEKGQPMYRKVDPATGKSFLYPLEF